MTMRPSLNFGASFNLPCNPHNHPKNPQRPSQPAQSVSCQRFPQQSRTEVVDHEVAELGATTISLLSVG